MRVFVKAKPRAHKQGVVQVDASHFIISVREPPEHGLANLVITSLVAKQFNVSQKNVVLLSGASSSNKVFEVY